MTPRRTPALALLVCLALGGCVGLPDDGRVRTQPGDVVPADAGVHYVPPPPMPDATPAEVVAGFLDAMLASPVQVSAAQAWLTSSATARWHPERRVIVYDDAELTTAAEAATVTLRGARWVDDHGRWRGALSAREAVLHLPLEQEAGGWRIAAAPDALVVRRDWFARHYQQHQVHFLDPLRRVLVPEPVFVPGGDQLATTLVRSLLAGPPDPDAAWLGNRLDDLELAGGTVTVARGVARVALTGTPDLPDPEARTELAAQLAWTLRQVPSIRTIAVRIDDNPLTLEGGLTEIPVGYGALLDPAGASVSNGLFGLLKGRPARLVGGTAEPIAGPLGTAYDLREVSIDLSATKGAGVRADGREARIATLDVPGTVVTVPGEDFAHPAWDGAGRVWLLDRRAAGTVVRVVVDGKVSEVDVPGVTGRQVDDALVSRDGSRLVAGVRDKGGAARLVVSRIRSTPAGVTASPARTITTVTGLRDLAWQGSRVLVLTGEPGVARVRWLSIDGAPDDLRDAPVVDTIFGDVRSLLGSGAEGTPAWARAADGTAYAIGSERAELEVGTLTRPTYVG